MTYELHIKLLLAKFCVLEVTYKLVEKSTRIDIRKYSFTSRIVNVWNSLPNYVFDVHSVDVFKTRLDKFWRRQDVAFDWKADLTGTGDRSESSVLSVQSNLVKSYWIYGHRDRSVCVHHVNSLTTILLHVVCILGNSNRYVMSEFG